MEDTTDEELAPFLQKAFEFIEEQRQTKNVLVHCIAGVSRSATIIAYYLMKKYALNVEESIEIIKKSRQIVRPNIGFYRQLKEI